jgi:hypothetical protein
MAVVAAMKGDLPDPKHERRWYAALEGDEVQFASEIARHGAELDALPGTAERHHAWAGQPIGERMPLELPPLGRHRSAFRLLLLRAMRDGTGSCMRTIPVVVRLAQDVAAGHAIFGALMLGRMFHDASDVLNACSRRATRAELVQARDDLVVLSSHPIPFGRAVQCELGLQMATLRSLLDASVSSDENAALVLWTMLLDASPRVAQPTAQEFPAAFELFEEELSLLERARIADGLIVTYRTLFRDYVARYAYSQARLRAMILALEAQITGVRDEPPAASTRDELADPFTGNPMQWGHLDKCSVVWTVGTNRTNDSRVAADRFEKNEDDAYVWACFEP